MSLADLPAPAIVAKVHSNRMPGAVGMMQTVELTQGIPEERVRAAHLSLFRGFNVRFTVRFPSASYVMRKFAHRVSRLPAPPSRSALLPDDSRRRRRRSSPPRSQPRSRGGYCCNFPPAW